VGSSARGHGARLLAIGDDLTDEHMFGALQVGDESIIVRHGERRRTKARWAFEDTPQVIAFLGEIVELREGHRTRVTSLPVRVATPRTSLGGASEALLVVSNRIPSLPRANGGRPQTVGGLVSALRCACGKRA
jgi:trehalose 6-phosphate synthase